MSDKDTTTPEVEVNNTEEEQASEEQTVGEFQEEETKDEKKVPENVPKARLDKEINRRKDLEAEIEKLKESKEPVDESEVKKLADKLEKIEKTGLKAKQDIALSEGLEKALNEAPEYRDIANLDLIKQMALNPANKDKTFAALLDEAYGNAVSGKRTTESTTPRGGAKNDKVDINKAQRDNSYLKEVLADPALRKQYNEGLETRIIL